MYCVYSWLYIILCTAANASGGVASFMFLEKVYEHACYGMYSNRQIRKALRPLFCVPRKKHTFWDQLSRTCIVDGTPPLKHMANLQHHSARETNWLAHIEAWSVKLLYIFKLSCLFCVKSSHGGRLWYETTKSELVHPLFALRVVLTAAFREQTEMWQRAR